MAEPSPPSPLLALHEVHKRFASGTVALQGVTMALHRGEFVSLLGPSGCGKSTVLRLAAGLDTASEGRVDAPATRAPTQADTAFVFQDATLMPWATVLDNVWLPLRLAGRSREAARPRIQEALARLGLAGFEAAYPRELSGGMRMRVSIARALVTQPSLLLMDEPFAALDEITRQRINDDLLGQWQAQRFGALFVTHSVFEAVYLSQRVLVMGARPGRIVAEAVIDAPYPREAAFRHSPAYAEHCRVLSQALARASAEVAA
jgi:NitT/TauT family transport system ATP-binding protein